MDKTSKGLVCNIMIQFANFTSLPRSVLVIINYINRLKSFILSNLFEKYLLKSSLEKDLDKDSHLQ